MRHPPSRRRLYPILIPLAGLFPIAAAAQTVSLDEGTFRLLRRGEEIGTEQFFIRQSGTGGDAVIIAQGTIVLDTTGTMEEIRSTLRVEGQGLRPAAYDVTIRGPNATRIAGRVVGSRFSARILSSGGEQMREYLASQGAALVDEGITHHHYFLAQRPGTSNARIPIIIPRLSRQVSAQISERDSETIRIGNSAIRARRLVLAPAGAPARHLWVDDRGRVLRLLIPETGYEAVRTSPPG